MASPDAMTIGLLSIT